MVYKPEWCQNPKHPDIPIPSWYQKKCKTLIIDTQVILKRGVTSPSIGKCRISIQNINNVINKPTQLVSGF